MLMWVAWRVETCAHVYRHARTRTHTSTHTHTPHAYTRTHTHTHTHIHNFPDSTAGSVYAISEKSSNFKKFHTVVAKYVYLYSYHLAALPFSWKFNFDELSKYVKIIMYIQFCMLTWFKILAILFIV